MTGAERFESREEVENGHRQVGEMVSLHLVLRRAYKSDTFTTAVLMTLRRISLDSQRRIVSMSRRSIKLSR